MKKQYQKGSKHPISSEKDKNKKKSNSRSKSRNMKQTIQEQAQLNFDRLNNNMARFKDNLKTTCSVIIDDIVEHLDSFFSAQKPSELAHSASA